MRYKPYGEDRDSGSSLNTDRKFTGQTEDETAGPAGGVSQPPALKPQKSAWPLWIGG